MNIMKNAMRFPETIFKLYDIRGVYPNEINEDIVAKIVSGLTRHAKNSSESLRTDSMVVGHDSRRSSPLLYESTLKTARSKMCKVIPAGLITTPMLYFLVNHYKAYLGIMITASHNPKQFNGLKIVRRGAVPMSGKEMLRILQKEK